MVGDGRLGVADPDGHPAQEAVALAHRQQRVERAAVEQPEVARVVLELDLGELVEQPVEPAGGAELEARLAGALLADRVDDVTARPPVVEHRLDQLRRVLEVGVEHHHGVAGGVVETGGERGLVAEVPRQGDDAHPRVAVGQLLQRVRRAVRGAVVDQHQLERQSGRARRRRARRTRRSSPPRCRPGRRRSPGQGRGGSLRRRWWGQSSVRPKAGALRWPAKRTDHRGECTPAPGRAAPRR